jgi:hypothetical protein
MRTLTQAEIYRYQATGELPDDYETPSADQAAEVVTETTEQPIKGDVIVDPDLLIGDAVVEVLLPPAETTEQPIDDALTEVPPPAETTEQPIDPLLVPPAPPEKKAKK